MKTKTSYSLNHLVLLLLSVGSVWAQRGPQDTWYETKSVALPANIDPGDLIVTSEGTILLSDIGNDVIQSEHPQIMQANEANLSWQDVQKSISVIMKSHQNLNDEKIKNLLLEKVEGFKPVIK